MSKMKDVRITQKQRNWIIKKFEERCAAEKWRKIDGRRSLWQFLGLRDKGNQKIMSMALFAKKSDPRPVTMQLFEKTLEWLGVSKTEFPVDVDTHDKDADCFFDQATKSLKDALQNGDNDRINAILSLMDAVIFTQLHFTVKQIKHIIFFIGEFLHMSRDRIIQPLPIKGVNGYDYGWNRLFHWMKHIKPVLDNEEDWRDPDSETGIRLKLFIPWCELLCIKMLRHKLFMRRNYHGISVDSLEEIKDNIRQSFLRCLCESAKHYYSIVRSNQKQSTKVLHFLMTIMTGISELDENGCRENARMIAERLFEIESDDDNLCALIQIANIDRQKAGDVLRARILLALVLENWARYMCYSTKMEDGKALVSLIRAAEKIAWVGEIKQICYELLPLRLSELDKAKALCGISHSIKVDEIRILRDLPIDAEFRFRLMSLVSDILFLKARQIDAWKRTDVRTKIRPILQHAVVVGGVLCKLVDGECVSTDKSFVSDKAYGDLARKSGYYARYCFDNIRMEKHDGRWLSRYCAINMARYAFGKLNLVMPWSWEVNRRKYCELLDKLYWDYLMEQWLEYDMRLSSFDPDNLRLASRSKFEFPQVDSAHGKKMDSFDVLAHMIMSYSEMTWLGNRQTDREIRPLKVCRWWAMKKLGFKEEKYPSYCEPRKTKMNLPEQLMLAMGTFCKFTIDPSCSTGRYKLQGSKKNTEFVVWARRVFENEARFDMYDVETLRAFIKIVADDFFTLCGRIQCEDNEVKCEETYLRAILRKSGEVPFPWHHKDDVRRCVEVLLNHRITSDRFSVNNHRQAKDNSNDESMFKLSYVEFRNLDKLIKHYRSKLSGREIGQELGISESYWSALKSETNEVQSSDNADKQKFAERNKKIIHNAARMLGLEVYEIVKALFSVDPIALDLDGVSHYMEKLIRALRNIKPNISGIVSTDVPLLESGLRQYYGNLKYKQADGGTRNTYILLEEWYVARYLGERFFDEIRDKIRSSREKGRLFYNFPSVKNWFVQTHLLAAGDAVNVLKLGFVGIDLLRKEKNLIVKGETLYAIVARCCEQMDAFKHEWSGTGVLLKEWDSFLKSNGLSVGKLVT